MDAVVSDHTFNQTAPYHDDKPALKLLDLEMDYLLPSGLASHSIEA